MQALNLIRAPLVKPGEGALRLNENDFNRKGGTDG